MYYSGIDLHRDTCTIVTLDDSGTKVKTGTLPTEADGIAAYFAALRGTHHAVVECTTGWYWLSDLCQALDVDLVLAHAKYLKAIAYAKVKTDAVDALTMAHILRLGYIPAAHQISRERRGLRDLLRHRLRLVETRSRLQTQAQAVLFKFNHGPIAGKYLRDIDQLEGKLATTFPEAYRLQLETFALQLCQLDTSLHAIRAQLRTDLIPQPDVQHLLTLPGVGLLTALTLYLEIDGIQRFPTVGHFLSYARLVPGAHNSGGKQAHARRKDGNRYLKMAVGQAAPKARQYYPVIHRGFEHTKRRKGFPIANALLAKELARGAYYVLLKDEPFHGHWKGQPLAHQKHRHWPQPVTASH
ncbi:MAG: IS110 family transposase [Candidatus Marinimicrobia bacterium]|nr:IS110 family transposase [Candidatus Neomarinimicrobiota bacterium]MCF7828724.1 IS110 family transposase [Candidatus Neomarinimicrobiota bacterium]MCF7880465.1 IS110 family transposase [Candidatus Neomarinimicrobiota bacterium]